MKSDMGKSRQFYFRKPYLPAEIYKTYEFVSCLQKKKTGAVYVVKRRSDDKEFVLKYAVGRRCAFLKNEYDTLKNLDFDFLPKVHGYLEENDKAYLIRDHIKGHTLSFFVEENGAYALTDAIELMEKICVHVEKLHGLKPPIIHRDIKPQNILVCEDGGVFFLDLDTARSYDGDKQMDTIYAASLHTAAPEQFGFRQSDVRTDVYSLGVLFLYLLTESYTPYGENYRQLSRETKGIIKKALAFDPADRYKSVHRMRSDLHCLKKMRMRSKTVALSAVCAAFAFLGIGLFSYGQVRLYHYTHDSYTFADPIVETAVRQALRKGAHDVITQEDLADVASLCICSGEIYDDLTAHEMYHANYWFAFEERPVVRLSGELSDMRRMSALDTLALDNGGLSDMSALSSLSLRNLSIRRNHVENIDFLKGNDRLEILHLDANPIQDISALSDCKSLRELYLNNTYVTDLSPVAGLSLTYLDVVAAPIKDLSVISTLDGLESFYGTDLSQEDIGALAKIKGIRHLGIYESDISDASILKDLTMLDNIDLTGCTGISDVAWVSDHPMLSYLGLTHTSVTDLSPVKSCEQLTHLDINGTPVSDLSVVKELPHLETLYIDPGKQNAINALDLPDSIDVIVVE